MPASLSLKALGTDKSAVRASISDVSLWVAKSKKIVVVTGAGISCSSGIPDFRSSDGLYALVKERYPDAVLKGRDLFDASLFRDSTSTSVFYTFISQLKQSIDAASPSATHHFIKTLDAKKKLLRSYTQNIDGLEDRVGLVGSSSHQAKTIGKGKSKIKSKDVKNVQLHGDIHRVRCMTCAAEYACTDEHLRLFGEGLAPSCPECSERSKARIARSARPIRVGSLRPAIVLYDEPHPLGDDIGSIQCSDIARKPDMLIIMGTSLKVHGLKKLVKDFARVVHDAAPLPTASPRIKKNKSWAGKVIFVNRTAPGPEWAGIIDYHVSGETDVWVDRVLEDWKKMRPADWQTQQTLIQSDGDASMSGGFQIRKDVATATKSKVPKKKSLEGGENIPPFDVFGPSTDTANDKSDSLPISSSPSKRRQSASHYIDSSPTKKRVAPPLDHSTDDGCCLLFANNTNQREDDAENDDMSIEMVVPVALRSKAKTAPTSTTLRRTRSQTQKYSKPTSVKLVGKTRTKK